MAGSGVFSVTMNRATLFLVAAMFAAFTPPPQLHAQSTNVKTRNTNQSTKFKSGIFKGSGNLIQSNAVTSFIGGGQSNAVTLGADYAVVGGGFKNVISNDYGTVGGGSGNTASGESAMVGGGNKNTASGSWSAEAGGLRNKASWFNAAVGGGIDNVAGESGSFYGGATVAGGFSNAATGEGATVGGGHLNKATNAFATVSGGALNNASALYATVSGGLANTNAGETGFIGGGQSNTITVAGTNAVIAGGLSNTVGAAYSFAAGRRAKANHAGSFVWADTTEADFASTADKQFLVRADYAGINAPTRLNEFTIFGVRSPATAGYGGMCVQTSGAAAKPFYGYSVTGGGSDAWTEVDGEDGNKWKLFVGGNRLTVTPSGLVGIGTTAPTFPLEMASGAHVTAGGVWQNASDASRKENFRAVDSRKILAKVAGLSVTKWNYRAEPGVDRIGPTAQDFRAAFGLGADDKHIGTLDADGVALAAIQGLIEEIKLRDEKIAQLEARSLEQRAESKDEIEDLKTELRAIREQLSGLPPR